MFKKILLVPAVLAGLLTAPVWANQSKTVIPLDRYAPAELTTLIADILPGHPRLLSARDALHSAVTRLQAAERPLYNPELEFDTENSDINTTFLQFSQTIDSGGDFGELPLGRIVVSLVRIMVGDALSEIAAVVDHKKDWLRTILVESAEFIGGHLVPSFTSDDDATPIGP